LRDRRLGATRRGNASPPSPMWRRRSAGPRAWSAPHPRRLQRRLLCGVLAPARGAARPAVRSAQSMWAVAGPAVPAKRG